MRRIIILERNKQLNGDQDFRYALWADVPAARQSHYANANFVSAVLDATTTEKNALTGGSVTELVQDVQVTAGTPISTVEAQLVDAFTTFQAQVNAYNPWAFYGTSWDLTTWTVKTTA